MENVQNRNSEKGSRIGRIALLALPMVLVLVIFQVWGNTYAGLDVRQGTRSLFVWLAQRWSDSSVSFGGNYSHGWLIPVIALWLVWRRRSEVRSAISGRAGGWGGVVIGIGLVLHWMGLRAELPQISVLGLIGVIWGIPTFLWGNRMGRLLFFPCGFLLFAVPVNIFDSMTFPLRLMATTTASGLLNALGIPVTRIGTAIHSAAGGGFHLDVADPCSGIRSLTALMAIVAAYGYVSQKTVVRKWALFLLSLPAAVIGNIARVVGIGLIAALMGEKVAVGVYHDYSGYLFYAAAVGVMLLAAGQLDRIPVRDRGRSGTEAGSRLGRDPEHVAGIPLWRPIVLAGAMASAVGISASVMAIRVELVPPTLRTELPGNVQGWIGTDVAFCTNMICLASVPVKDAKVPGVCPECGGHLDRLSCAERNLLPADTTIVRKRYGQEGVDPVSVTVVFSGRERSSIHRPEICLVSQGFRILSDSRLSVPLTGRIPLDVQVLELESPSGGRQSYAYWFTGGAGRETPSHVRRIFWMAADRIFRNRSSRWAYVSVLFPVRVLGKGQEELRQFIIALYPDLLVEHKVPSG